MNALNISEMAFASLLATLVPADSTKEQRDTAEVLLKAYINKTLALDCLSAEYIGLKVRFDDLRSEIGVAVARSMRSLAETRPSPNVGTGPVRLLQPEGGR